MTFTFSKYFPDCNLPLLSFSLPTDIVVFCTTNHNEIESEQMKWITRERPKIDRIACPWLIKNFVDAEAEFIYVPADKVNERAEELKAIPFDVPGVEFS